MFLLGNDIEQDYKCLQAMIVTELNHKQMKPNFNN